MHISCGNSVFVSCVLRFVSRLGTVLSPGEVETSGFHHMIAYSI